MSRLRMKSERRNELEHGHLSAKPDSVMVLKASRCSDQCKASNVASRSQSSCFAFVNKGH